MRKNWKEKYIRIKKGYLFLFILFLVIIMVNIILYSQDLTLFKKTNNQKIIMENYTSNIYLAKRGCCSRNGGVCGCKNGKIVCCNGSLSPSCRCN